METVTKIIEEICVSLQWCHNERDGVSNHRRNGCLLNRVFGHRWNKTSKLSVIAFCLGNPTVTGGTHKIISFTKIYSHELIHKSENIYPEIQQRKYYYGNHYASKFMNNHLYVQRPNTVGIAQLTIKMGLVYHASIIEENFSGSSHININIDIYFHNYEKLFPIVSNWQTNISGVGMGEGGECNGSIRTETETIRAARNRAWKIPLEYSCWESYLVDIW